MKRVFLSGPVSKGDLANNVNQATEAFVALAKAGFAPLCPQWGVYSKPCVERSEAWGREVTCEATTTGNDAMDWHDWMNVCLPWVGVSDAILRLPGESVGADRECEFARSLGIPVFHTIQELMLYAGEAAQVVS